MNTQLIQHNYEELTSSSINFLLIIVDVREMIMKYLISGKTNTIAFDKQYSCCEQLLRDQISFLHKIFTHLFFVALNGYPDV